MKRIRLLTVDYPPQKGGVARYLSELIRVYEQAIEVAYRPKTSRFVQALLWVLKSAHTSDLLIISHVYPLGFAAMIARFVTRTPYVLIFHGMDFDLARRSWWRRFVLKRIIWSAKLTIANSHALANEIAAFAKDEKPMVVYPPLSSRLARRRHPERAERVEGSIHLLTVCRLVERKGIDRILHILPKLENAHYTIVGDGEDKARLESLTAKLGIQDRVIFAGMLDDDALIEAYQSADLFVMPTKKTLTDREGFGMVYLEAGYFGLPVVGSNHTGVSEAILDGETGYLVHDDEELLKRLQELTENPHLRDQFGEAGQKRSKQFVSEVVFAKFKRIIERYA